tara:strand:- start:331 stop:717 length:387 start_codon:yes stop_codon:yes gene_type:complete
MSLGEEKRTFLRKLVSGLDNLLRYSNKASEIGLHPKSDVEIFIKKQLLVQNDRGDYEFSKGRFTMGLQVLEIDLLSNILIYFDNEGFTLARVFKEASINALYMNTTELYFAVLIEKSEIETFLDFITY